MKQPKKDSVKHSDQELLELGKKLQTFYEIGYVDKRQALRWAFLKGVATGFGAVVGSTIVIAVVLWILSLFTQLPFIHGIDKALQAARNK